MSCLRRFQITGAHPRVSGENDNDTLENELARGSSPRERGKHEKILSLAKPGRLIPA